MATVLYLVLDRETGEPITTEALRYGHRIAVVGAPCDERWHTPDGIEILTEQGRARIDSAMATYLKYLPTNPIIVEGYATEGTADERFRRARQRAGIVREHVLGRYELPPQNVGYIPLGNEAVGSPAGKHWDGVALTLFLDRTALQFVEQRSPPGQVVGSTSPAAASGSR